MVGAAFIISMTIFFGHASTWDGQINSWVRKIINEDSKFSNPIYNCPICMTPWWGTLMYIVLWGWGGWREWIATVGCASGISVFNVIFNYAKDYFISRTFNEKKKEEGGCC
jgi:hypothetical protein